MGRIVHVEGISSGQLVRVAERERRELRFFLDDRELVGLAGDSVLTAILVHLKALRESDFSGVPRAGFCLIGACQDCWIWTDDGARLRACTTVLQEGMRLRTAPSVNIWNAHEC